MFLDGCKKHTLCWNVLELIELHSCRIVPYYLFFSLIYCQTFSIGGALKYT